MLGTTLDALGDVRCAEMAEPTILSSLARSAMDERRAVKTLPRVGSTHNSTMPDNIGE